MPKPFINREGHSAKEPCGATRFCSRENWNAWVLDGDQISGAIGGLQKGRGTRAVVRALAWRRRWEAFERTFPLLGPPFLPEEEIGAPALARMVEEGARLLLDAGGELPSGTQLGEEGQGETPWGLIGGIVAGVVGLVAMGAAVIYGAPVLREYNRAQAEKAKAGGGNGKA